MSMDTFSPTAPARIRTLVIPVGRIKRSRFYSFLNMLSPACEIRLGDVSPDPRPDRNMFSPLAFPDGIVLYEFSTSVPSASHLALSPFEMFREPLAILGIADSKEIYPEAAISSSTSKESAGPPQPSDPIDQLSAAIDHLREEYPRALTQKIFMFDSDQLTRSRSLHQDVFLVPAMNQLKTTTMKTIMCDFTSVLLAEMTTLAISIKALPSIASPSASSSGSNGLFSAQWYSDDSPTLSRTNSQTGDRARSASPAVNHLHRMSMPVLPSSTPSVDSYSGDSRPTSPESGFRTPPAKTFDEIAGSEPNITGITGAKVVPTSVSREQSRDRVSVHGFGPGSVNERNRNKGKCRVSLVIGSLYLQAGRWNEALRELTEGAIKARSYSDHLWHAKALENVMVCMILLAWSGVDFKIPQICYPMTERSSNSKIPPASTSGSSSDAGLNGNINAHQAPLRRELAMILPDLMNMVMSIYNRAGNFAGEFIPQLAWSEFVIRCAKILTSINLAGGALNDQALQQIVRGIPADTSNSNTFITRMTISPTRTKIADILLRAMPGPIEQSGVSAVDQMLIFAGIASVFSALGLQRKKAIMLKEYLDALIQALMQAKKTGAAEAGIHPSTNLITRPGSDGPGFTDAPEGLEGFLNLLCQVYGIPESKWSRSIGSKTLQNDQPKTQNPSESATAPTHLPEQLVGNFVLRFFGSVNIKSDVLRTCIQLCEALPDLNGILHYTSALLRAAGPGIAPSTDTSDVLVTLSREEQVLLANNISKTVADAALLGLHDVEAEYWDEFLIRGIYLVGPPVPLVLHPHKRSDLGAVRKQQKAEKQGPFIHNPFLEKANASAADNLLVAGDEREFVISLQNPYDFEVKIESMRLIAERFEFASAQNLILRPYRTQSFSLMTTTRHIGRIEIGGCIIKIQGCRERTFPIFSEPWAPEQDIKIKSIGLLKAPTVGSRPVSDDSVSSATQQASTQPFPKPGSISLTVIPEQPVLAVTSVSLPQSALMLLEGESRIFQVTVTNTSQSAAVDFVHLSFRDSTATAIQEALGNKRLSPAELYELEYQLSHHPAIRACEDPPSHIPPGQSATLKLEVLGKPGLATAVVQVDYANLKLQQVESEDNFFTRHVTVPISVTVNASIQLHRMEIMPVSGVYSFERNGADARHNGIIGAPALTSEGKQEHCLLLIDLRNAWPTPLEMELEVLNQPQGGWAATSSKETVQPGHISRMILLLPKIYIKNPHAPIRSTNERQFVVSMNNISPEAERLTREAFWYREELLKMIRGSWKQEETTKAGIFDLRSAVRLNSRMIDVLRLENIAISMSVLGDPNLKDSDNIRQYGGSNFEVRVDDYLTLRTRVENRSDATIYPLLRLRPSLAHQPPEMALELGKRFTWSGLLQRILSPLAPGEAVEADLAICTLCSGNYEVGASVEEVKVCTRPEEDDSTKKTGSIPDPVAGTLGRRTWTASEPCKISARRG